MLGFGRQIIPHAGRLDILLPAGQIFVHWRVGIHPVSAQRQIPINDTITLVTDAQPQRLDPGEAGAAFVERYLDKQNVDVFFGTADEFIDELMARWT